MITDKVKLYNQQTGSRLTLKAVFFDMDGVLFDSMPYHAEAWVYAMETAGVPFTSYDAYMNEGRTGTDTINTAFLDTFNRRATEEECREIYRLKSERFDEIGKQTPMADVYDLLKKIKAEGLQIYVVTGSAQKSLLNSLNNYFPNIFDPDKIVSAFDVTQGKPHPEPYLKALEKARLQPFEAAVVENAPLGVESARAAGIFTIAVNTGILEDAVLESAGANAVFPNMEKLNRKWEEFYEFVK